MCFGSSSSSKKKPSQMKPRLKNLKTKLILLGDMNVGKSSICEYYRKQAPAKTLNTIGVTYFEFDITTDTGQNVHLDVWDTAGQEAFQSLLKMYYKDASIVFLVFDVTARSTLDRVEFWIAELKEQVDDAELMIVLIGNKSDVEADKRQVPQGIAEKFARDKNLPYFETSALTGQGVNEVFKATANTYAGKQKTKKF